jgi:hypothetical protein
MSLAAGTKLGPYEPLAHRRRQHRRGLKSTGHNALSPRGSSTAGFQADRRRYGKILEPQDCFRIARDTGANPPPDQVNF